MTFGDSVQKIPAYAFYVNSSSYRPNIKSVTIGNSVTSIGDYAFRDCSGLTSITIPDSVTSIGDRAFYGCTKLESVTMGDNVVSIGKEAFYNTVWYNNQENGVVYIGNIVYGYRGTMPKDTTIVIKEGTIGISPYAFSNCTGLVSITIPESVTSIGSSAFSGCSGLTSIYYTGDMTSWLGKTWQSNVMASGRTLYIEGSKVEGAITIPDGVSSIPSYAVAYQKGITSVTIPDSVTSIGERAFYNCSGLTSVTIGNGVTSIGSYAFYNCSGLTEINWNAVSVSDFSSNSNVFYNAGTAGDGITVTFGDSVEKIPAYLFYVSNSSYRPNIKSVTIGNGVTSIRGSAFYNCTGLIEINWNAVSVSDFSSGNNVFYNAGTAGDGITVTFGDSVQKIPAYAFYVNSSSYRPNIVSVTIGNSVTSIGDYAFRDCSGLTSITIPDSVTSIGSGAFRGCSGLTSITIPDSVTSIGSSAFRGCSGLTSVTIGNSVTSIRRYAFFGCSGLTSITIPDSVTSIGSSAFSGCSGLTSVTIGNSVTSIGSAAFEDCSGLTSVTIGNGVTSIGSSAFSGCSGLTSITIPDSVTSIGSAAFEDCSGLTSITISDSVTSIGERAFYNCSDLTSIYYTGDMASWLGKTWQSNVMASGRTLYIEGSKVEGAITIPDGVSSIPSYAFAYQKAITSVLLPEKLNEIGAYAFYGCSGIELVILPSNIEKMGAYVFGNVSAQIRINYETIPAGWDSTWSGNCTVVQSVSDDNFTYSFNNEGGLTVNAYIGNDSNVIIPSEVNGVPVTQIGSGAFTGANRHDIKSVSIPDSVTIIGAMAFFDCSGLTSVVIPDSVTDIGAYAFMLCPKLSTVTLGSNVAQIGIFAFYYCHNLVEVYNRSTLSVDKGEFAYAKNIYTTEDGTRLSVEDGFVFYYDGTQAYLVGYNGEETELVLPAGFTAFNGTYVENYIINPYTFYGGGMYSALASSMGINIEDFDPTNSTLQSVYIPGNIIEIGEYAFYNNKALTSLAISSGVKCIGQYAFYGCSGLTSIVIPDTVTSIGKSAFVGTAWYNYQPDGLVYAGKVAYKYNGTMPSNTSIVLKEGTLGIAGSAFEGCSGLTSITIPDSVTSIGGYAFEGCSGLTSITIPDSVTSIGSCAFDGCSGLTSIVIPDSVTSIGSYAFRGCTGLTSIIVEDGNPVYHSEENCLIETATNTLILGCKTSIIPDSVTSIGSYAFDGCSGLTSIVIPDSVTSIGSYERDEHRELRVPWLYGVDLNHHS